MLQQKVNRSLLEKSTDSFGWVGNKATTSDSITGSNLEDMLLLGGYRIIPIL
jgi:hypothetical protein